MTSTRLLNAVFFLTAALTAAVVLVTRRPEIVLYPTPWAEDGVIWLKQIYDDGFWTSLLRSQDGYYQTISRLSFGLGLQFGVENATLVATLVAATIRIAFLLFVLSPRMAFANIWFRLALVVYFLLMPGLAEGYINVTNAHWYLSMYLIAILLAEEPKTTAWKVHDIVLLLVSGLSGPFIVFVALALAVKKLAIHRTIGRILRSVTPFDVILAVLCVVQVAAIILTSGGRSPSPLDASVQLFAEIMTYRVLIGAFVTDVFDPAFGPIVGWTGFAALLAMVVFAVVKGGWRVWAVLAFICTFIAFAFAKPMISTELPQWPLLLQGPGYRYFFMTNVAFVALLLFLLHSFGKIRMVALAVASLVALPVLAQSYRIPPVPGYEAHQEDMARFEQLQPGEAMDIRIAPPGWVVNLEKR